MDVLVTDASGTRTVSGLTANDFVITEDDQPQGIAVINSGGAAQLPRSIVLILDRSESQLAYIESSVDAAKRLVKQLAPGDEMAIVTDDIQLTVAFTKDKKKLTRALDSLKKWTMEGYRTRSMQFSALLATLREMIDVGEKRPIIIFQTDGDEVAKLSNWPPIAGEQLQKYEYNLMSGHIYKPASRSSRC
jgi:VWFA-related protein